MAVEGLPNGAPKVVRIKVESILKSTKVKIPVGDLTLWAETGCVCQKLQQGRHYVCLCIMYVTKCMVYMSESIVSVTECIMSVIECIMSVTECIISVTECIMSD